MTDVHSFAAFYKDILLKTATQWDARLTSGAFDTIGDVKRVAGIREGIMSMHDSFDSYVTRYIDNAETQNV